MVSIYLFPRTQKNVLIRKSWCLFSWISLVICIYSAYFNISSYCSFSISIYLAYFNISFYCLYTCIHFVDAGMLLSVHEASLRWHINTFRYCVDTVDVAIMYQLCVVLCRSLRIVSQWHIVCLEMYLEGVFILSSLCL